jgi:hypothetical protein
MVSFLTAGFNVRDLGFSERLGGRTNLLALAEWNLRSKITVMSVTSPVTACEEFFREPAPSLLVGR